MQSTQHTQTFDITGMDCAGCAKTIETSVGRLDEVESCSLNFVTAKLQVVGNIGHETITTHVRKLGFDVVEPSTADTPAATPANLPSFWHYLWQQWETRLLVPAILFVLPGLLLSEIGGMEHRLIAISSLAALVIAGVPIVRRAWRSLWVSREITINLLMSIAAVGAVIIGAYTEAAMVMVLFALGESLEGYTADRARNAIQRMLEVAPNTAVRLTQNGSTITETPVPVAELQVGDVIVIKPGERIPMDGEVRAGASTVNQAAITGESRPIEKAFGATVFAGSINGEGALEVVITKLAQDNTISRMIALVAEAQERRAPAQRFVDRFASVYTPVVVVLAVLVAAGPPLFFNQPFFNPNPETFGWFYRGLALLVVACPCALVISTPVSIASALSAAARRGVLIKGGAYLEILSRVRAIAFDKTGTLTKGKPSVVAVSSVDCAAPTTDGVGTCAACDDVLALAYAVERRSEHPLAQAITTASVQRGVSERYPTAQGVTALVGHGITGQVDGQSVTVGSHRYFDEHIPHAAIHCTNAAGLTDHGQTPLLVSRDGRYQGMIVVSDTVREDSQEATAELQRMKLNVVMLTGDSAGVAQSVAAEAGIPTVQADLLPEQKVAAVAQLQSDCGVVAMIGDGINDAPALATADIGIALGAASGSTTQAMETADVTLMSDDLRQLPFAVRLSRAAMRTVKVNVVLSIGIKLLFLVIVLLGMGTLWMAVLADMGTSLLVTLNGMRLLRWGRLDTHSTEA